MALRKHMTSKRVQGSKSIQVSNSYTALVQYRKIYITIPAPMPQHAATARILKTAEPTMVPTPMSPSVMKVPMTFTNNSGAEVAAAIKVAPATSFVIFKAVKQEMDILFCAPTRTGPAWLWPVLLMCNP
jgi:hypothetical protein